MRRFVRRPSPALVLASLALLLSLTGTGLADIAQLGRNVVGTPQLRTGAVTTPKIRNGAVTSAKFRNRSVTLSKLALNARIPGPRGPAGPQGPPGPQGPAGAPSNIADGSITSAKLAANAVTAGKIAVTVRSAAAVLNSGTTGAVQRSCDPGERALAGGAGWTGGFNNAQAQATHIVDSFPSGSQPTTWLVRGYNGSGTARSLQVRVICIAATP